MIIKFNDLDNWIELMRSLEKYEYIHTDNILHKPEFFIKINEELKLYTFCLECSGRSISDKLYLREIKLKRIID